MLANQTIEDIGLDAIEALVQAAYAEDREIDYKRDLPDLDGKKPDEARKKFLADVASFANAGGGDILFGVEEGRDGEGKPNGVPTSLTGVVIDNLDALQRRWMGIVESGLDPRIAPKIRLKAVDLSGAATSVLVLRVPRSYAAPHMVKETGRFHVRHGPENRVLDTGEIRSAILMSEGWAAKVRRFRDERLARVFGDDLPVRLRAGRLVVHVIPRRLGEGSGLIDLHALKARNPAPIASDTSVGVRFNADGLLVAADEQQDGEAYGLTQFFRDGCVEAVMQAQAGRVDGMVRLPRLEGFIFAAARLYPPVLEGLSVTPPFAVLASLVGVKGMRHTPANRIMGPSAPFTRDVLTLPDATLESAEDDLDAVLRPMCDALWQCLGYERSPSFDPNGKFVPSK